MCRFQIIQKNQIIKLIFASFILFSACSSLKQPKEVYEAPDYTEEDVKNNEISQIQRMIESSPVEALWRALLLNDEKIVSDCESKVFELYNKAVEEKDTFGAYKYFLSLENSGSNLISSDNTSGKALSQSVLSSVPGIVLDEKSSKLLPKNLTDCVNATVTIWVDKGIRIQNGIGYADRVLGSGFFIDSRGYIVTNHHVISDLVDPKHEGYTRLYIKLARDQETRIPAKVIGYDSVLDLALLKAEIDPLFVLALGSSRNLTVGEKLNAIGTPLGLHGTVTSGIVSAVDRKLFTTGSVFQIDAAVNSGNSGGPCIDQAMKVQAIVFAGIQQYQGLNFAIPVEYLRQDLPFLYNGGKRNHAWIGGFGHTKKEGLRGTGLDVQYVMPGGVLSRSGVQKGDVINSVNGVKINSLEDFQDVVRNLDSDMIIKIGYLRDGEPKIQSVYLESRPEQPGYEIYRHDLIQTSFIPIFGMELVPCSTMSSRKYMISDVINGSVADESGFSINDPVYVSSVDFSDDKKAVSVALSTRKKKHGYLDVSLRMAASLDSPYYF